MYTKEVFKKVIEEEIEDASVRVIVDKALDLAPSYFWKIAASQSGKNHPPQDLGDGGLIRHTLSTIVVAREFKRIAHNEYLLVGASGFPRGWDLIIAALILHDAVKLDDEGKTNYYHPQEAGELVRTVAVFESEYLKDIAGQIAYLIEGHMGQWGVIIPCTPSQKLVALCDYMASRKWANIDLQELI